jgi:Zn finger protein HypA/HybF involved in hydrogenase expression
MMLQCLACKHKFDLNNVRVVKFQRVCPVCESSRLQGIFEKGRSHQKRRPNSLYC